MKLRVTTSITEGLYFEFFAILHYVHYSDFLKLMMKDEILHIIYK